MMTLKVIHRRRRTGFEETKDFPVRVDDLIAGRYQVHLTCNPLTSHANMHSVGIYCVSLSVQGISLDKLAANCSPFGTTVLCSLNTWLQLQWLAVGSGQESRISYETST